jgi:hypothetical protein
LTNEEEKDLEREIDKLARKMPDWQKHLAEFRARHPELTPQEVMKKAGFTFRMKKGKLISDFIKPKLRKIMEDVLEEERKKEVKDSGNPVFAEPAKTLPGTDIPVEWNETYPHAQQREIMDPLQYLDLVIPPVLGPKEAPYGFSQYSVVAIDKAISAGEPFWSLRLDVDVDERAVTGHEGRHRAYWAWKKGYRSIPVVVWHERDGHPVQATEKVDVLSLMNEVDYKNMKYPGPMAKTAEGKPIYADRTAKDVALGHTKLASSSGSNPGSDSTISYLALPAAFAAVLALLSFVGWAASQLEQSYRTDV